jgi:DNA-binding CsgD family transcriptional regulator
MTARAKRVPPEILWRYITASPCAPASACEPESMSEGREASLREFGLRDIIYVRGLGPDHSGCVLAAGTAGRVLHPRQIAAMSRVGAHVAAAFRLRRNRGQVPEAIFDGRGRLVHAEGAATGRRHRDLLASAVTAVERSRGPLRRRDPEEAVALWRALVAGRWSLVERFEADGRRFLLARVNVPEVAAPLVLTPAERRVAALLALGHPQKLVCYELGVSSSTVSTLAASALRKLGFASRAELIRLLGARRS